MKTSTLAAILLLTFMAYNHHEVSAHRQRNLCSVLSDYFTLIPKSRYDAIVNKHYKYDAQFRYVTKYVQTVQFEDIVKALECSASYRKILTYLRNAGVDTDCLGSLSANIQRLLKPVINYNYRRSATTATGRSLQTFSNEIVNSISHEAFYQMVVQKMRQSRQFAKFYTAVRKNSFRTLVLNALNGRDVAVPLRTLKRNGIDVRQQVLLLLKVISWGPSV